MMNSKFKRNVLVGIVLLVYGALNANNPSIAGKHPLMWLSNDSISPDVHAAFRGRFVLDEASDIELQFSGASWYVVWLDGNYFYEGPDRYPKDFPDYQSKKIALAAGNHLLAIHLHYEGVDTRMLKAIQPFLYCRALSGLKEIPIVWKCLSLKGYDQCLKRINAQLGWVEWVDTRKLPFEWQKSGFDDALWQSPVIVDRLIGELSVSKISNVKSIEISPRLIAEGKLAEVYGYEKDNISARFFLRDLECKKIPPQGIWRRYDMGRVRLSRPKFIMDLPEGTIVEFAYSEQLFNNRVSPWISLSLSDSYNLDHFVARGGVQEFFPLTPRGGRFMEVHIFSKPEKIKISSEKIVDRCYYDQVQGSFTSNDTLLNKIWRVGIDTYMACAEDALIDNPTRERGQWMGDVGIVGVQIGSVGFSDLKICRRGLVQCAQCARADGMVAGLCPGGEAYLSSYAAQWVLACLEYWRLTGDKSILEELYPAAQKNIEAFNKYLGREGVSRDAGWAFIDWGYVPNPGPSDMGLNLHCYMAIREMEKWSLILGKKDNILKYNRLAQKLGKIISDYFADNRSYSGFKWESIGYHRTVLGIIAGFIPKEQQKEAVEYLKKHILNCFPNSTDAPRLSDPHANNPQLITPYFAHYAFQTLIENGEIDFVLNQYRKCWGWALEDNRTTWVEVFDTRWTHCHQWAGCPTWQLSRYVLGLTNRFDISANRFDLNLQTGSLIHAEGDIPLPDGKMVHIKWEKKEGKIIYEILTSEPIIINIPAIINASKKGLIKVNNKLELSIPVTQS
jgi:alpha-L-rhamnosidase